MDYDKGSHPDYFMAIEGGICMLRRLALAVSGAMGLAAASVSPVMAASPPSPYTNGALVQFQGNPAIYQVHIPSYIKTITNVHTDISMTWIPNAATFNAMGLNWSQVHVLPAGIPQPRIQFIEYLRLATNNKYPYQLNDNGTVSPILPGSTPSTQNPFDDPNLPGPFYPVSQLPGPLLPLNSSGSQYSLPPIGSVVRHAGQSAIYLRTPRGDFSWIPSSSLFNAAGFQWSQVKTVPDNILLNAGSPKTVVHVVGSSKVYATINDTLHWIPSSQDFASWGFSWNSLQTVQSLPYPVGAPLTASPQ
jgi:hypothetical protein